MKNVNSRNANKLGLDDSGHLALTVPIAMLRLTTEEILVPFTPVVRDCFRCGNPEVPRVAVHLTIPRQAVEQSSTARISRIGARDEKKFKVSADKATCQMSGKAVGKSKNRSKDKMLKRRRTASSTGLSCATNC